MAIQIREALPADLPHITEIYRESVLNGVSSYEILPPDREEMKARYDAIRSKGYPYLVAEEKSGTLLGYAYASAFRTRPAYRWLVEDSVYLAPDARGRGIGKILLSELLCRCEPLGFRQMVAVIGGASPASMALHRSLGFDLTGTLRGTGFKHGRWLDTVLMQKALGDGTNTDPEPDSVAALLL